MSQAYTPGLLVTPRTLWRCRRVLPVTGSVLVKVGDMVTAQQVVAETETPGDAFPVNLAKQMGISASQVPGSLVVPLGSKVVAGELLAKSAGLFGLFRSEYHAQVEGTVEAASGVTGQVILRGTPRKVQVTAYLSGEVMEVIPEEGVVVEAAAAVVQGIFGIGGEAHGRLVVVSGTPDEDLTADVIAAEHRGAVLVAGRRITKEAFDRAREIGVSAIIGGGIDDQDLREILGFDLGVAVTGSEQLGITLIVTEGFGEIAMARRTFELFQSQNGSQAAVNGTTQIRAGVLRPEILIPLTSTDTSSLINDAPAGVLEVGAAVRIIREPHFGVLGRVASLPPEPTKLASESKARVVQVKLADGDSVLVPRANVELIEGART